jgi:hypothetical protein
MREIRPKTPGYVPPDTIFGYSPWFFDRIEEKGVCWLWKGYVGRDGYGYLSIGELSKVSVRRYAYELMVGPLEEGLVVRTHCGNKLCVAQDHLFLSPPPTMSTLTPQQIDDIRWLSRQPGATAAEIAKICRVPLRKVYKVLTSESPYALPGDFSRALHRASR